MTVYLVGAGPGAADLLTVRAARLLLRADVVVVDRLVGAEVRSMARPGAVVVDVGKLPGAGDAEPAQSRINELLVEHGRRGATVVRLKGGDPFVFGRGGEELLALRAAGVDVEVVPGITSALGVPALAGVPVTHRGVASSVTVSTGHDVEALLAAHATPATSTGTLVLLMAVANRARIACGLVAAGRDPATPVAVLERATTPRERRIATTLERLGAVDVAAPAVIVIGEVAALLVTEPATRSSPAATPAVRPGPAGPSGTADVRARPGVRAGAPPGTVAARS